MSACQPVPNPKPALLPTRRKEFLRQCPGCGIPLLIRKQQDSGSEVASDCRYSIVVLDGDWGLGAEVGCQIQLRMRSSRSETVGDMSRQRKWCIPGSECRKASPVCRITIPISGKRDIKNEGASGDVYENIRKATSSVAKNSAFCRKVYGFLRHLTDSGGAFRRSAGHE